MALAEFPPAGIELAGRSSVSDCRELLGGGLGRSPRSSLVLDAKAFGCVRLVRSRSTRSYLVDPASSHMLVSKIKPCMSQYTLLQGETANGSLNQSMFTR